LITLVLAKDSKMALDCPPPSGRGLGGGRDRGSKKIPQEEECVT